LEFLKALGVDARLLIIQAAGFLILLYILRKYLFDSVLDAIKARKEEVQETYRKSEQVNEEAANLKAQYERKVTETEEEAEKKLTAAVQEAKALGTEILDKSRQEAETIKQKAHETVEMERKKAAAEIRDQVVGLSILATEKLIQQTIAKDKAERLVDEFIKEAEGLK
jgi:F-type H+-transporting ATPase subunit b